MSFLQILILVCSLSFGAIIFLIGFRIYYFRNLKREEICRDLVLSKPFFGVKIYKKINFDYFGKVFSFKTERGQKLKCWFGKMACFVKNKINGRHKVKCEKCSGYWGQLNDVKKTKQNN